jgi:UDP-N-acetylmuramate dehydrogenase
MHPEIQRHQSLKPYNTFGIDVKSDFFAEVQSVIELKSILSDTDFRTKPLLILGGGSNVLFTSDFHGLVILNRIKGIDVTGEDDHHVWIKAASGEVWHDLVMFTIQRGWGGLENLSLIPGSVGASPMQNIGAYGVEIKDSFFELEALDLETLELIKFNYQDCEFGYRESVFKHKFRNRYFITSVTFRLSKIPVLNTSYGAIRLELESKGISDPGVKDVSDAVIAIRRSKLPDPAVLGNAGSFFKNPEISAKQYQQIKSAHSGLVAYELADGNFKLAAGWLIEQCGWKGKRIGETGSHKDQSLVLVNYGNARGKEIQELAIRIRESVYEKFGVWINPEVNII